MGVTRRCELALSHGGPCSWRGGTGWRVWRGGAGRCSVLPAWVRASLSAAADVTSSGCVGTSRASHARSSAAAAAVVAAVSSSRGAAQTVMHVSNPADLGGAATPWSLDGVGRGLMMRRCGIGRIRGGWWWWWCEPHSSSASGFGARPGHLKHHACAQSHLRSHVSNRFRNLFPWQGQGTHALSPAA